MDPSSVPIEEKLMFLERDMEQLRDQVTELWKALEGIERRMDRLQKLLEDPQTMD